MEFSGLEEQIKSKGLQPVYLIHGPERFLRGDAVRLIQEAAARGKERLDVAELDAVEMDHRKLFEDLQVPSLFAPKRLIVVENADQLLDRATKFLLSYVKHPSPRTTLVLVAETITKRKKGKKGGEEKKDAASAKERKQILLELGSVNAIVECPALPPYRLAGWCAQRARAHGKVMDEAAAGLLVTLSGGNLGQLDGQIESLIALCKDQPRILVQDVEKLIGSGRAYTVWELVAAASAQSPQVALRALQRLLRDMDSPAGLIPLLGREVRRMISLMRLSEARCSPEEIERRLNMPSWLVKKLSKAAGGSTSKELQRKLRLILDADVDLKTGVAREEWVLERLILNLCGVGGTVAPAKSPTSARGR